jgi:hypothetical protein
VRVAGALNNISKGVALSYQILQAWSQPFANRAQQILMFIGSRDHNIGEDRSFIFGQVLLHETPFAFASSLSPFQIDWPFPTELASGEDRMPVAPAQAA